MKNRRLQMQYEINIVHNMNKEANPDSRKIIWKHWGRVHLSSDSKEMALEKARHLQDVLGQDYKTETWLAMKVSERVRDES